MVKKNEEIIDATTVEVPAGVKKERKPRGSRIETLQAQLEEAKAAEEKRVETKISATRLRLEQADARVTKAGAARDEIRKELDELLGNEIDG